MIDALERQPTVDDLRAKLKSAQSDLETERDWDMSQIFDPGDLQQRRAADLVSQAFALKDQLAQLKGQKEYGRTARRLDGVMEQIGNLHGKGIVAKATRDLLTAENANDIELGSLRDSITATLAIDRAQKELAAAEADLKLGLDDQELRQMGLGEDDVREIHATIGHLAKQGLRSSADVEQTAKAIRNGLALLERGMTQGTLGQLSNAIPESRANLLMDLVFQDVTRDHRNLSLTAESDEVREAFRRAMESLLIDRSSGQETVTAMQLRLHGSALQPGRGGHRGGFEALDGGRRGQPGGARVSPDRPGQPRPDGEGDPGDPGRPLHGQYAEPGALRRLPQGHRRRVVADRQRAHGEPEEDDPEAYIRDLMQNPQNGFVAVTTLRQ